MNVTIERKVKVKAGGWGYPSKLTKVGLLSGSRPFALQNRMARCVRFARWAATVC